MTEIEQLRKEINELRERIAKLEAHPTDVGRFYVGPTPTWVPPQSNTIDGPPWIVT